LLTEIFRQGYNYQKCGVQLSHIQPESSPGQLELFDFIDNNLPTENRPLMKAISVASTGFDKTWEAKADKVSPRYTTDWRELQTKR
jgi:DNA polymerase V